MARDIEEFLRRAAERRKKNQQGGGKRPTPSPPPASPPPTPPPRQPMTQRESRPAANLPSNKPPKHETVTEHVNRYIDVSDVADVTDVTEHASHLAETIEHADDRMDQHVHDVFDHEVGNIHDPIGNPAIPTPGQNISPIAQDLLNLFKSQHSIRQAILVNEILKRPDFDDEDF